MVDSQKFDYKEKVLGIRHLQCVLIFLGLAASFALRVNMSVAIVAMTDKNAPPEHGIYSWDEQTKPLVLGSFFCGYVVTQIPSGQLAERYGGHKVLSFGTLICSILAILTPLCAKLGGLNLVCALRLCQGLCQGSVFPSTHNLLSKWAPIKERGMLGIICYSGTQLGIPLMLCLSGDIIASSLGWPGIFYISGGIGCVWSIIFYFFGSSSPSECRFISDQEKMYIEMLPIPSVESPEDQNKDQDKEPPPKIPTPWLDILTSVPFYCVVAAHCTNAWTFNTLLTQVPTYLKNILGLDIKKNGLLSSLPYWTMFVLCYFFLFISEVLRKTQCMSLTVSRKFFNTIGTWIPAIALVVIGYMDKDNEILVIFLLMVIIGLHAACFLGFMINHIDLSPNFAGTLMGMTNGTANIMSILAPLVFRYVVTNEKNPEQWRIVFFISGGLLFVGNLMFICFGKFKTQYWNERQIVLTKTVNNKSKNSILMDNDSEH